MNYWLEICTNANYNTITILDEFELSNCVTKEDNSKTNCLFLIACHRQDNNFKIHNSQFHFHYFKKIKTLPLSSYLRWFKHRFEILNYMAFSFLMYFTVFYLLNSQPFFFFFFFNSLLIFARNMLSWTECIFFHFFIQLIQLIFMELINSIPISLYLIIDRTIILHILKFLVTNWLHSNCPFTRNKNLIYNTCYFIFVHILFLQN